MDSVTVLTKQGSSSRNTLVSTVEGGFFGLQLSLLSLEYA
jgi:hypothetical protein